MSEQDSIAEAPNTVPTVFMIITQGFRIRSMLFSDVLPLMVARCRLVILVPAPDVEAVRKEFGAENVLVEPIRATQVRIEKKLYFVRRNLLSNPKRNRTISIFSMAMKQREPFNYWLIRFVNPISGRFRFIRDWWLRFEAWLIPGDENADLFKRYSPKLVVTTDYGSHPDEVRLLRYAHRLRVQTASVVYSWDNLSSKGVMGCRPNRLIVWNEIMRQEAVELHDYTPDDVRVCGAAQFDVYAKRDDFQDRDAFCRRMRLDPAKPIIVLGTISPKLFPENLEILDLLIEAVKSRQLAKDSQILVRLHPQTVNKGVFGDELQPYWDRENQHPFVRVDVPETVVWGSLSSPGRHDSRQLAEILHHGAVMIHPGSTLVVDAAAMDCPCIGLGFDGLKTKPYEESVRRWWDFTYMQPIVKSGGQPIASSAKHLVELINQCLMDRSSCAEGRALIREQECYRIDGKSAQRVVRELEQFLAT